MFSQQNPAAVIEKKPKEPQLPKFANKIPSTRPINDQPKVIVAKRQYMTRFRPIFSQEKPMIWENGYK